MKLLISIKETQGIERKNEPLHIPIPAGTPEGNDLAVQVIAENGEFLPCQVYTDLNGIKTVALTMSCRGYEEKKLIIKTTP